MLKTYKSFRSVEGEHIMNDAFLFILIAVVTVILTVVFSNKEWIYQYGGYTILVKNTAIKCVVYANDTQIAEGGMFAFNLNGKLDNGEEVKVKLSAWWSIKCSLYIDNMEIFPSK